MSDQAQEKIEELATRNRLLVEEKAKLYRANIALSSLLASRNETILMLEEEGRRAKAKKATRKR